MAKMIWRKYLLFGSIMIWSMLISQSSFSCTTPVFRYALEMWSAFNYRVEVIHNGNLNDEQIFVLNELKNVSSTRVTANIIVTESSDYNKFSIPENSTPQILLFHPAEQRNKKIIWQGDLTKENVAKIIDSPARREIVRNIQKGDAITWILLEGKDKEKNTAAYKTLSSELDLLSNKLKLASDATDVDGKPLDINIINRGVHFSSIPISRNDPAEEVFIQMLLNTEPDLPFVKSPMAFPIFGRGRVLYALVGNGIKQKLIEATCNSVIGWCSCTIKEDNPGADLLFTADWEEVAGDSTWIKEVELPEITGMSGFIQEQEIKTENKKSAKQEPVKTKKSVELKQDKTVSKVEIQPEKPAKIPSEDVEIVEAEESVSSDISGIKSGGKSPLTRNIVIVVLLLLILMPTISFYLRRKRL